MLYFSFPPTPLFFIHTRTTMAAATAADALRVVRKSPHAVLPAKGTPGAAGYDLYASEEAIVPPHGRVVVKTGIVIATPTGTYGRIAGRSSLAVNFNIDVAAGVIDSDYRGEVGVVLCNHSPKTFTVGIGDRVAQLILERYVDTEVMDLPALEVVHTTRGSGAYGSTGR